MTSFFDIPSALGAEIEQFAGEVRAFAQGTLSPAEFRHVRVGWGVYEQRTKGTYMVRVRCTGGGITSAHLRAVAQIAATHSTAPLHLTTRQELQIHSVPLDRLMDTVYALHAAGLATRGGGGNGVRNIIVPWDAGVAPDDVFNVMPYAVALMNRLGARAGSWLLPRKLKMAVVGSARGMAEARSTDLGFVARLDNGQPGFSVHIAGGMGRASQVAVLLHEFIPACEAYVVAEAVKRVFATHGNRTDRNKARLRFLWNDLGREQFMTLYHEERTTLMSRTGWQLEPAALPESAPLKVANDCRAESDPAFDTWLRRFVSPQRQPGLHTVLLPVSCGVLAIETALSLVSFLESFDGDFLRCTTEQNLALRNIPAALLPRVHAMATQLFPLARHPRVVGSCIACTGAATCTLGLCCAPDVLRAVEERLVALGNALDACPDVRVAISGCTNACGRHLMADLGFAGMIARHEGEPYPAYTVFAGARLADGAGQFAVKKGEVAARDLPDLVASILLDYARSSPGASFATYVDRGALAPLLGQSEKS